MQDFVEVRFGVHCETTGTIHTKTKVCVIISVRQKAVFLPVMIHVCSAHWHY